MCQKISFQVLSGLAGERIGKTVEIRRVPNAVKGTARANWPTGFGREGVRVE